MKTTSLVASSILSAALGGCGGGGGSLTPPIQAAEPPPANIVIPEGLYTGTTSTGRSINGLVLDDGTYYVLYSATNNPGVIAGAVQGTGAALNGSFSSSNGKDINLEGLGVLSATVSTSYTLKASLNGTIAYPSLNQTLTFTSTYDAKYEISPSLATIAGTYSGRAGSTLGAENGTITISTSGTVTARGASGCTSTGTITPRTKGNAYNATLTFGGSPCSYPHATFTGGAYYDASTKRLYAVGLSSARDAGFIFSGAKP
jgi:hypothetical protein